MKYFFLICMSFVFFNCSGSKVTDLYQTFPGEINGWEVKSADKIYDRTNLYDYVDGGAELYLTYDFKQVFTRKYSKSKNPDIILDVYEMGNDAYGIFSIEREDDDIGIGENSEYGGGLLRFWKGRYFVSIISIGKEKTSKSTVLELAKMVAEKIESKIPRPAILSLLPEDGIVKNSIKYFHSFEILNRQYFISEQNILKLNKETNCVLSNYKKNAESGQLLVIEYPTENDLIEAKTNFIKNYIPDAKEGSFLKLENGKWIIIDHQNKFLKIALEFTNKEWALSILNSIKL